MIRSINSCIDMCKSDNAAQLSDCIGVENVIEYAQRAPGGEAMNGISAEQIEYFLTVANCRSISHAAKHMYISQPALSNWIKQFETQIGMKLFERSNRGIRLTENGLKLYAEFDQIYNDFRISIDNTMRKYSHGDDGAVRVGSLHSTDAIVAMEAVREAFEAHSPVQHLRVEYFNYQNLISKLLCGELDVIFTLSFDAESHPDIESLRLRPIDSYFYVPAAWGIAELDSSAKQILEERPLLLELNNSYEISILQCRRYGFEPKQIRYTGGLLQLINIMCDGEGFTISGGNIPICRENRGRLIQLRPDGGSIEPEVYVSLAWKRTGTPENAERFIEAASHVRLDSQEVARRLTEAKTKWYSGEPSETGR
jgi:DNA-binding transcriptional LysR family regulator